MVMMKSLERTCPQLIVIKLKLQICGESDFEYLDEQTTLFPYSCLKPQNFFPSCMRPIVCVAVCLFIEWRFAYHICSFPQHPTSHSRFKRHPQNSQIKKKGIKQRLNDASISQLSLPRLAFVILLSFLSESDVRKALHYLLLGEKCLAQVHERTKIQAYPPMLMTLSDFCLYSRTFHFPLPLSDEGKCQETVEDSPLLWTFPTGRVFWYLWQLNINT